MSLWRIRRKCVASGRLVSPKPTHLSDLQSDLMQPGKTHANDNGACVIPRHYRSILYLPSTTATLLSLLKPVNQDTLNCTTQ